MGRRLVKHELKHEWGGVAIAALALLVLAAGLCAFDQDGEDEHLMFHDLCLLALLVPAVTLLAVRLHPGGVVPGLDRSVLVAVALSVPQPPPRSTPLASFLSL
jgi:hypothetical protein